MKKIIQFLITIILLAIIALIVVFVFNPADLRTKLVSSVLNSYLSSNLEGYTPLEKGTVPTNTDQHPLLNDDQEKTLQTFGVDVAQLPTEITPAMQECFVEKLGQERAMEIVNGASPGVTDFFKAKDCLNK